MKDYIKPIKGNIFIDLFFILIFSFSFFVNFSEPAQALVRAYTSSQLEFEIEYPKYTNKNQVTIKVIGYNIKAIYWNGLLGKNEYTVTLQEGENLIKVSVTGKKQTQDTDIVITKDTNSPKFADTQNATIDISNNNFIDIHFNEAVNTVLTGEKDCVKNEDRVWICELKEGENIITFKDIAGNESKDKITATKDTEAPKILSEVPSVINQKPYQLKLEVSSDTAFAWLNDNAIEVKDAHIVFDLTQDKNDIKIKLKDNAGNEAEYPYTIIYKEPQKIVITNPINNNSNNSNNNNSNNNNPTPTTCYSFMLSMNNIKTQVFAGESQSPNLRLTCNTTGAGISGKPVSISVKYSNGTTNTYNGTTNADGFAYFSWVIPDIKGSATITATYNFSSANQSFTVN